MEKSFNIEEENKSQGQNKIELNIHRWKDYQNLIKEEITLNDISKSLHLLLLS